MNTGSVFLITLELYTEKPLNTREICKLCELCDELSKKKVTC